MSYKLESHQILAGSLNLLAPGDKIPEGDCLELSNWRVDQQGLLRSRRGVAVNTSDPLDIGGVGSLAGPYNGFGRFGSTMYIGAGPSLFRNGSVDITDAGDGNPFFFVAMQGFMWVMNRGVQGADDGTTFGQWGVTAPQTAPTYEGYEANGNLTGVYNWYISFLVGGNESNLSPASTASYGGFDALGNPLPMLNQSANLQIVTGPGGTTGRNLYRTGGTLGQAYLVLAINDNVTTDVNDNLSDLQATLNGVTPPTQQDPPPPASGIVGPYFSRILAWSSATNINRMWWTRPDEPAFFPGSADPDNGQWVDVGDDGEAILNITVHTRLAIIYKERSIWRLIGDPDTGTLEKTKATVGLIGPMAVVNGGGTDYGVSPDGVFSFDMDTLTKISPRLDPIFQGVYTTIAPGVSINPIELASRATIAMALVNGIVYIAYPDVGSATPSNTLLYHIAYDRWGRASFFDAFTPTSWSAMFYPVNTQDFWGAFWVNQDNCGMVVIDQGTTDFGTAIDLAFQSAYYNQGAWDTDKVYTSLVIEFEAQPGDNVTVLTYFNAAAGSPYDGAVGTLTGLGMGRQSAQFALGGEDNEGVTARSISVRLECSALNEVLIHSITLYYYLEARLATLLNTIPLDLGSNKVKQVRELELDIDTSDGVATAQVSTDLPGNQLAVQAELPIAESNGRRNFQLPFTYDGVPTTYEGRLLRLSIESANNFRLYGARLLMRTIGVYVEDYEASAGYLWDSQEHDFSSHITHIPKGMLISLHENPIKRARTLELDIETRGSTVTAYLMTDLPGEEMEIRFTVVVPQSTGPSMQGRQIFRATLPMSVPGQPLNAAAVEGRLFQLRIGSTSTYILYGARLEILPIGVYLEAYEAAGGAVYDSREMDFGVSKVKDARELQLDIETSGAVTVKVYGDVHGTMTLRFTTTVDTTLTTPGRRKVNIPLTAAGQAPELDARLWQLVISGTSAFRLYAAALHVRAIGVYVDTDAATGASVYDSTPLAIAPSMVKQFRTLEVELDTMGPVTLTLLTDLPQNSLAAQLSQVIDTTGSGRRTFQIPLPQGAVPDNYLYGKLMQVMIAGTSAYKLFGARVEYRAVGTYVEAYEAAAGAVWDSSPLDLGQPQDKVFDQLRFEMDADGACSVTVWTDLPGETLTVRYTQVISTTGFGRRWVTMVLPANTHGRLIKVTVSSTQAFRLYQGQLSKRILGRYISAGQNDIYRSLDQDFGSERVKIFKYLEVDIQTDGTGVPLTLYTDQPGYISAARYQTVLSTNGRRQALRLRLPGNIRGKIARVEIGGGANSARLYMVRGWTKTVGESATSTWDWAEFPVEKSESLAAWVALPVAPTAAEWTWADLPVEATPPEFTWMQFSVLPTGQQWDWAVFPVEETPTDWTWVDVPMGSS
jgi:hypothetical protein